MKSAWRSLSLAAFAISAVVASCTVYDSAVEETFRGGGGEGAMEDNYVAGDSGTRPAGGRDGSSGGVNGVAGALVPPMRGGDGSGGGARGGADAGSGGNGGSAAAPSGSGGEALGGASGSPRCADQALSDPSEWTATASDSSDDPYDPPSCLVDNDSARWSSGKAQSGDEWIEIDFGETVRIRAVNLQQGGNENDYPRGYQLRLSDSSEDSAAPVLAAGVGIAGVSTTITLPATAAGRYLLISQTGTSLAWWSVTELEVSCYD